MYNNKHDGLNICIFYYSINKIVISYVFGYNIEL